MTATVIERYNARWPGHLSELEIEIQCIRHGGTWKYGKKIAGQGLFYHYERIRKLLWPQLDDHRWHTICSENIIAHKVTVLMGPKSSGKTNSAAVYGLIDYYCFPEETTTLVSSTDVRGLELRVFGEIKMLHEQAKAQYPWLPGKLIDSKHAIFTAEATEDDIRDWRNAIIGIPCLVNGKFVGIGKYCFPSGTAVDTPIGKRLIESIKPGDVVYSAAGESIVEAVHSRIAPKLIRLHLNNGKQIDCTPNHRFLTLSGWQSAVDIPPKTELISTHEAMYILREATSEMGAQVLFKELPASNMGKGVCPMRKGICTVRGESSVLQSILRWEMEDEPTGNCSENDCLKGFGGDWKSHKQAYYDEQAGTETKVRKNASTCGYLEQEAESIRWSRYWAHTNKSRNCSSAIVSRSTIQLAGCYRQIIQTWTYPSVLDRFRMAKNQIGGGDRRELSQSERTTDQRRQKRQIFERPRVVSIEILKPSGDTRYRQSENGYRVYNLQIASHPSYSVNGLLVHNCGIKNKRVRLIGDELQFMGSSFLDSIANLDANPDFKVVLMGNPNDPSDPLGKAAEPKDGWSSMPVPEKTTTWQTRFMSGICVNLVGTDSPNFDQPGPPRYRYLIHQGSIDSTVSFYGTDSLQYSMFCKGVMRTGLVARRVVTRTMAKQFHAQDEITWLSDTQTSIYAVDAAYGAVGGDRCIGGDIKFGRCPDGKVRILVSRPSLVPVRMGLERTPEDQIADWVKRECIRLGISPQNVFYDSTGRGSLGTAFARLWSAQVNPVEFGGRPTDRPVSLDLYVFDPKLNTRRLKLCSEHYSKRVTEFWYTVRYAIESDQVRGLPEDVLDELCAREWKLVKGLKIEIESKPEMKERFGRSPDLADWLVTAVEGARQRGFSVSKLAQNGTSLENDWMKRLQQQRQQELRNAELTL